MRTTAATLILLCSASIAHAQLTEPRWSSRFASGVSYTIFEDGAVCLKAFDSPMAVASTSSAPSPPPAASHPSASPAGAKKALPAQPAPPTSI